MSRMRGGRRLRVRSQAAAVSYWKQTEGLMITMRSASLWTARSKKVMRPIPASM